MQTPISSQPASSIAAASGGYSHPPLTPLPWLPPVDPLRDPALKAAQGPLHLGGQDPNICPEKKHFLNDRLKEQPRYLQVLPIPSQDPRNTDPVLPRLTQVTCHYRPVIATNCQQFYYIFEPCHRIQQFPIGLEVPIQTTPQILPCQLYAFPFYPLGALGGGKVPPVQCMSGHQHVALVTPFLGKVYLLQNDTGIPDIPVGKYTRIDIFFLSYRTTLNGTVPWFPGGQKLHPVCMQLLTRGRGFPTLSPLLLPPMLCLHVSSQQPEIHLLPVIIVLNSTPLPLLVRRP